MTPSFDFEQALWNSGKKFVAGLDEVGRGAFAGPLVTAAVIFPPSPTATFLSQINDSKKVSPPLRIKLAELIKSHTLWSIGSVPVAYINHHGIAKATFKAMRLAVSRLPSCDHLLIDAFRIPHFKNFADHQTPIVKGDQKSLSIAAASIIAKVYRDQLMTTLHTKHPLYGFDRHKGYGTQMHQNALRHLGPLKHHRTTFIKNCLS